MIDPVQLYHQLARRPFQPVRVHLVDGRVYDVPRRDMIVVGVTYLDVGIQAPGESEGICTSVVNIPLEEIRQVEPLSPAASPL